MKKDKKEVKLSLNSMEVQFLRHVLKHRLKPENELELLMVETLITQLEALVLQHPEFEGSWEEN